MPLDLAGLHVPPILEAVGLAGLAALLRLPNGGRNPFRSRGRQVPLAQKARNR